MSYLSGIARLPASRKVIIAGVATGLLSANEWARASLGFALSPEAVIAVAAIVISLIWGIAYEDGQKAVADAMKPADPLASARAWTLGTGFHGATPETGDFGSPPVGKESGRADLFTLCMAGVLVGGATGAAEILAGLVIPAWGAAIVAGACLASGLCWIASLSAEEPVKRADPTPPVASARSESGRANTSGLVAFLGGCFLAVVAILASGCCGPAAKHAADEARRAAQYVAWMESGTVPVRAGVLEPASLTHALPMLRSQARAWEAQAYYLGSGPRPAWAIKEE